MSEFKKVKMLNTEKGSPDGISVRVYEKGETYDLPTSLADVFLGDLDCCEEVEEQQVELTDEEIDAVEAEATVATKAKAGKKGKK